MRAAGKAVLHVVTAAVIVVALATCGREPFEPVARFDPAISGGGGQVVIGAADIATCSKTTDDATADLVDSLLVVHPDALVFTGGDNVSVDGTAEEYAQCYDPGWGRFKSRTWATIGNHEYNLGNANPTFEYFGERVGPRGLGYYSVDVGNWHLVMLNSNSSYVPLALGSTQDRWLRADLAANTKPCILAVFHHPRFYSSDTNGSFASTRVKPFWDALYEYGADVIVDGHAHHYERFAPQDPDGNLDLTSGIRQFIVGTGGTSVGTKDYPAPNSEIRNTGTVFGVIKFTLHDTAYEWEYLHIPGYTFTDSGSGTCTGSAGSTAPTVTISEPTDGSAFTQGTSLTFAGTATDAEDGSLTASLAWTSSRDGTIGSGATFSKSNLSVGTHTITASVTDSDGLQGSDAITVTVNAEGANTLEVRVAADSDDGEESSTGSVSLGSSDLELVFDGSNQTVGVRFNVVSIPRGVTITDAYIQFTVDETPSDATSLTIQGEATDNAATFSSSGFNISSRSRTASSVPWSPAPWTTVGAAGLDQRTPTIASIIHEIVNRPGWSSGNSLAIIVTGTGERVAESHNGMPTAAPLLHVDYLVGSGSNGAPMASFTHGCTDLTCNFSDTSTDTDGTVMSCSWSFGDGGTSTAQSPSYTYAAAGDYTVTLTVTDDDGATSAPATRLVTVTAAPQANQPPTAADDAATVAVGGGLEVAAPGVLTNDSDPEGGALTVTTTPVSGPSNGTLTLNSDGSYGYTHDGSETTSDAFAYEVCDAGGQCDTATVNLTITGVTPSVHVVTPSGSSGYATSGGKNSDLHIEVTVMLVDGNGVPVVNASVEATIHGPTSRSFSGNTNSSGQVVFKHTNATPGTYTTTVTAVTAPGLTWDGTTPPNGFTK